MTQVGTGRSGLIHTVGEDRLEVQFTEGLFQVRWSDIHKELKVRQYIQITECLPTDRQCGWVHTIEGNLLQLIYGSNNGEVKVHHIWWSCLPETEFY